MEYTQQRPEGKWIPFPRRPYISVSRVWLWVIRMLDYRRILGKEERLQHMTLVCYAAGRLTRMKSMGGIRLL